MQQLSDIELNEIKGGQFSFGVALLIIGGLTLIAGIVDGIINPSKCNN